jgi:hypothetical protein
MSGNSTNQPGSDLPGNGDQKKNDLKAGKTFYEKWKDPGQNKMGNDISSEIKIANSGGAREEGYDKEWHMEDNSEKGDEEIREDKTEAGITKSED